MTIKSKLEKHWQSSKAVTEDFLGDESAQTLSGGALGTTLTVVVAAIAMIIGLFVFSEVNSVMPDPSNPDLSNATATVVANTGSAFTLLAVGLIVLAAAFILGILITRFTARRQ